MTHLNKLSDDLFNSSNYLIDFLSNNLRPNGLGDMVIDDEFVDKYYLFLENLQESLMTYEYFRRKHEKKPSEQKGLDEFEEDLLYYVSSDDEQEVVRELTQHERTTYEDLF